jgi:archaellin
VSTTSAANDLYVTVKTNAGTLGLDLTQFNLVLFRIAPYA